MPSDNNDLSVKRRCVSNNKKGIKSLFELTVYQLRKEFYITIKKKCNSMEVIHITVFHLLHVYYTILCRIMSMNVNWHINKHYINTSIAYVPRAIASDSSAS